jgi:hypothetical protein
MPHVGSTSDFLNVAILFIELVESGISVSLQRSSKLAQMRLRMFYPAIWRVSKPSERHASTPHCRKGPAVHQLEVIAALSGSVQCS